MDGAHQCHNYWGTWTVYEDNDDNDLNSIIHFASWLTSMVFIYLNNIMGNYYCGSMGHKIWLLWEKIWALTGL